MDYTIAEIGIRLPEGVVRGHFEKALAPFATTTTDVTLELKTEIPVERREQYRTIDLFDFREADAECRLGIDRQGYLFEMISRRDNKAMRFRKDKGSSLVTSDCTRDGDPSLLRFGLWTMFNLTALSKNTVAIHASVVTYRGRAVLFLGESGTGKSTHTRLWRQHIQGAGLLNDDSPFVNPLDKQILVFGSPWSGKTPCYKSRQLPLHAIVRLSQAPHNQIRALPSLHAYGALHPSFPPAFVHDQPLFDTMNDIASAILSAVPVYHLACRPDAAAARLCRDTLFNDL